ncbi:NUC173 domain-containing protein [Limtongia smithiae]|uniref:NUC173 domain-containing protein n=1 Tax=Limtongia smithiae TaxID=1125753 RepID=UPI0034CED1A6
MAPSTAAAVVAAPSDEPVATVVTLESKLQKVRLHKTSKLPHQKQLATLLTAVEATLAEQQTELSAAAYLIALLSLLSQAFSGDELTNPDLAASAVYLLDLVIPDAPQAVLIRQFAQILAYLTPSLTHDHATPALIRSAIGCLESLLAAQDSFAWQRFASDVGPRKALTGLLSFALDERPKVRKRAQEAVTMLLNAPPPSPSVAHPALNMCAEIALHAVRDAYTEFTNGAPSKKRALASRDAPSTNPAERRTIFALQLSRAVAMCDSGWPASKVEALCEVLFAISRSTEEYLVMAAMDVFQALFRRIHSTDGDDEERVDAAYFVKIVDSIMSLKPARPDQQLTPSWLAIVAESLHAYSQFDGVAAFVRLPALFHTIVEFMDFALVPNIVTSAAQCLVAVSSTCIPANLMTEEPLTRSTKKVITELAKICYSLLSVQYQSVRQDVLHIYAALFDSLGFAADPYLIEALLTISGLRSTTTFEGRNEADEVIAAAIRALGPEGILKILPLNLEKPGPKQPGRAFLLPLLRDNIRNAPLAHFIKEMLPLAERLQVKAAEYTAQNKTVEAKIFETLVEQIWSLFPRYCDLPTDLHDSFSQNFAESIANLLYQRVDLRQVICKGLRMLVESNKMYADGDIAGQNPFLEAKMSTEEAVANLKYLSNMASKFLAVLFNVFSQTTAVQRVHILDTIDVYLSITPEADMMTTFAKVNALLTPALAAPVEKSSGPTKSAANAPPPPVSHTMLDLIITMIPYLPSTTFPELSKIFLATIQHSDAQVQKRGYRVASRLAQHEAGAEFLVANMSALEAELIGAAENVTPPVRGPRLSALVDIVRILPSEDLHFIPAIIPEAVIGTKEVNEKTREAAYKLLVEMGDKMAGGGAVSISKVPGMDVDAADVDASIEEFFTMISAGLAGATPHMISATITALSRLLYQYKSILEPSVVAELVSTIDLFLTSKNREIVKSALGFVKVLVTSLPREAIEPRLATLVPNLLEWAHEHHARFKLKVKHLLERLVRRFGVEAIDKVFPEADKKLLANIRKSKMREQKRRDAVEENGEELPINTSAPKKKKYLSEFEEAIYGSDSDSEYVESDDEATRNAKKTAKAQQQQQQKTSKQQLSAKRQNKAAPTYILESASADPVDLLDRSSLSKLSSAATTASSITSTVAPASHHSKMRLAQSGKILVDDDEANKKAVDPADEDARMLAELAAQAAQANPANAYIEAVTNGPVRGQRNRLKFKNKRSRDETGEDDDGGADEDRRGGGGGRPARKQTRRARF